MPEVVVHALEKVDVEYDDAQGSIVPARPGELEASGIETDLWQIESTEEHRSGTISTDGAPDNVSDRASKCAETALAKVLLLAAEAARWDVVVRIATEWRAGEREASHLNRS
ncbi:MAG TPA: hypothetical protein VJV79_30190 [Polyangiaceae bacterium]|nr:hypothetical protein [Polyangiaceae bacterium]